MALNDLGIEVPSGSDMFDPDGDMRELGGSLAGRIIVPVANVTERDSLAATLNPSPGAPLYVHRATAQARGRLEWTEDGTTWHPVWSGSDEANIEAAGGWSASSAVVSRSGAVADMSGSISRSAASTSITSSFTTIGTVPSGFRPAVNTYGTALTHGGLVLQCGVTSAGGIVVRSMTGNQTWASGMAMFLSMVGAWRVA